MFPAAAENATQYTSSTVVRWCMLISFLLLYALTWNTRENSALRRRSGPSSHPAPTFESAHEAGFTRVELDEQSEDKMDMVVSTLITHKRNDPHVHDAVNRLDMFLATLTSYGKLPLEHVFLFVELDDEFVHRERELFNHAVKCFGARLVSFRLHRWVAQSQWQAFMRYLTAERANERKRVVWFIQNDDHVWIDFSSDLLREGIALLRAERRQRYATMSISHWAQHLRLSGKLSVPQRIGSFVRAELTLVSAVQVFTAAYLRLLFVDLDWLHHNFTRIDLLLTQPAVWSRRIGLMHTDESLQAFYVPLREQCRKFRAYAHVNMSYDDCPPLTLPPHNSFTRDALLRKMLAPHQSMFTDNNPFEIPDAWIDDMLALHAPVLRIATTARKT